MSTVRLSVQAMVCLALLAGLFPQHALATFYRFEMKTVFLELAGVIDTSANSMEIRQWKTRQGQFALAPDASGSPVGCIPNSSRYIHLLASTDLPDGGGEVLTSTEYIAEKTNPNYFQNWYQLAGNGGAIPVTDNNSQARFGINGSSLGQMHGFIAGLSAVSGTGFVAESIYVPDFVISTPDDNEKLCGELIVAGDTDGDQVPDSEDIDDDNDGILDVNEGAAQSLDTDGDFIPDALDLDSDGDNVPDYVEGHDANQDGIADQLISGQNSDQDGLDDRFDPDCLPSTCDGITGTLASRQNTGGSSQPDFQDDDDDGDLIPTVQEQPFALDSDGDGIPDYLDPDQDHDRDGDQIPDVNDDDDDGDGVRDTVEGNGDADNDGIINRLDTDSDDDLVPDSVEAFDVNHLGQAVRLPSGSDSDNDGLDDAFDTDCTGSNCNGVTGMDAPLPDTDGDNLADLVDTDDDDDGLLTSPDEDRDGNGDPRNDDVDSDGTPDYLDDTNYIALNAKVFLQGAIEAHPLTRIKTDGLMRASLRDDNGQSLIPLTEPYTDLLDFQHTGLGGGETAQPYVFQVVGQEAIVDWVFVELRDIDHNLIATRAALLQRDGDVVDIDGQPPLLFNDVIPGEYKIAIRHRNHLGVMRNAPVLLSPAAVAIDFTAMEDSAAYHNAQNHPAQIKLGEYHDGINGYGSGSLGKMAMWAGNASHRIEPEGDTSGVKEYLTAQGAANDKDQIFIDVISDPDNTENAINFVSRGYKLGDIDMDGQTKIVGLGLDSHLILINLLRHPLNTTYEFNFIAYEQMPSIGLP